MLKGRICGCKETGLVGPGDLGLEIVDDGDETGLGTDSVQLSSCSTCCISIRHHHSKIRLTEI